ncbi:TonB family protein [Parabacteroides sp. PFB2-12]|uniref:energy transducer TonB family protein n=1 Tax=unclassified Parabacteroides TaxID=2649774 RepID=UPI0024730589|nr:MULTISPECIES: energy transducer TonB [unclassified Parabacteroides]MDH6342079.1 TonB family protein [Parabacteroides sp. PM6-13]MDH6389498.1 TonB family protein [Parabacteroides sp. PFB2-12]
MKLTKENTYSLIGTLVFHLIVFLILWFTVLKTVIPQEEEGILVNFGNLNTAAGTFEPRYTGETPTEPVIPPPTPVTPSQSQQEELITQDLEESIALNAKQEEERKKEEERKRREAEERERLRREEAERQRLAEEKRKKEEEISNRISGAFGMGSTEGTSQGNAATGTGNQGNPFGNSDQGANEGVGGWGSFDLKGRSIGAGGLQRPSYNANVEGKIVIDIVVDPRGNVIDARTGKGTTIENASIRQSAIEAARRTKFNAIQGLDNQSGTITYKYNLN